MAKINLKKGLPEGFKMEGNKIVKDTRFAHGGNTGISTGQQRGYSMVTNPFGYDSIDESSFDSPYNKVNHSIKAVPRDEANIEAEGGETILTDTNDDGVFEFYDIVGKRHHKGGVPLDVPEQSFVFSDTAKMKLNKGEMEEMNIQSDKKLTPAKISKNYKLNDHIATLDNPLSDKIATDTADYMLDKNKKKLSQLAFLQEAKKGFEEGVPLASYPYLKDKGIDPIQYSAEIQNISEQEAAAQDIAQRPPDQQEMIKKLSEFMQQAQPPAGQPPLDQMQQPPMGDPNAMAQGMPPQGPMPPQGMAPEGMAPPPMGQDPFAQNPLQSFIPGQQLPQAQEGYNEQQIADLKAKGIEWNPDTKTWYAPAGNYNEGEASTLANQVKQGNTILTTQGVGDVGIGDEKGRQTKIVDEHGNVSYGTTSDPSGSPITYDKENFWSRQGTLIEGIKDPDGNQVYTKDNFDMYNQEHLNAFQGEKNAYLDRLAKSDADITAKYTVDGVFDKEAYYKDYHGYFGNVGETYTAQDGLLGEYTYSDPGIIAAEQTLNPEVVINEPIEEIEVPDFKPDMEMPEPEFWIQDQLKMMNLMGAKMNLKKHRPWEATNQAYTLDKQVVDPRGEIQDIQEQARIAGDSTAWAGSKRNMAAKLRAQGVAGKQISQIMDKSNEANLKSAIQTGNMNATIQNQVNEKNNAIHSRLHDKNIAVEQNFDNAMAEINTLLTDQLANSYTNMANTYNMNTLYPQFNIDPTTGGMITDTNLQKLYPTPQGPNQSKTDKFITTKDELKARGIDPNKMPAATINQLAGLSSEDADADAANQNPYAQASPFANTIGNIGYPSGGGQAAFGFEKAQKRRRIAKKGAELRKWFSPLQGKFAN